ncbi:MAG: GGDEF domain-containing protein [Gemmatimonadota bacterium]
MLSALFKQKPAASALSEPAHSHLLGELETSRKETALVLDALGAVLQFYAKHAVETDSETQEAARETLVAWTRHAMVGSPRPGQDARDRQASGIVYRDWKGLVQFFGQYRRKEAIQTAGSIDNLRDVVWSFVSSIHRSLVEERLSEQKAMEQLERVRTAALNDSTENLRREAIACVIALEDVMKERQERLQEQMESMAGKVRALGEELEQARRESTLDPLTGLSNRKAFDGYISRSIELHTLLAQTATLMMIDVDHFKAVNDTHGHPTGDMLLQQVAGALSQTVLRRCDFVCRYGGDEFAIILQETAKGPAMMLGDRVRAMLKQRHASAPELPEPPTLSIGVAELTFGDDAAAWIKRADAALYAAKAGGRDQVACA